MRILSIGFIVIFMAMLILPLAFVDLSSDRVSVQENRMLAAFPKLTDLKRHQGQFIRDFDAWFKDSTGFREQFLALYKEGKEFFMNGVQYMVGEHVYIIGWQGHHFYIGDYASNIKIFQGGKILSDEQLSMMANKLEEVKIYLESKGIPLIFMICASKESIYPEYYPKSIKRGSEPIQLDVITNYIKEHTSVDVFNIRQALLAEKNNYKLYPVSFGDLSHYTEIGAFFAYRELMKHINIYFPEIIPFEINDVEITYDKLFNGIPEPDVSLKSKQAYKKLEHSFFDDVELVRPFSWENAAYENIDADLPVIMVFRDSFSGFFTTDDYEKKFLTQFIASRFSKAIFIHYLNLEHFEQFVDKYKPDIVVFESAERELRNFANWVNEIPEFLATRDSVEY